MSTTFPVSISRIEAKAAAYLSHYSGLKNRWEFSDQLSTLGWWSHWVTFLHLFLTRNQSQKPVHFSTARCKVDVEIRSGYFGLHDRTANGRHFDTVDRRLAERVSIGFLILIEGERYRGGWANVHLEDVAKRSPVVKPANSYLDNSNFNLQPIFNHSNRAITLNTRESFHGRSERTLVHLIEIYSKFLMHSLHILVV